MEKKEYTEGDFCAEVSLSAIFDRWIDVNEREPEINGKYKVKRIIGSMSPKIIEGESTFTKREFGRNHWSGTGDWVAVTHWKEN